MVTLDIDLVKMSLWLLCGGLTLGGTLEAKGAFGRLLQESRQEIQVVQISNVKELQRSEKMQDTFWRKPTMCTYRHDMRE